MQQQVLFLSPSVSRVYAPLNTEEAIGSSGTGFGRTVDALSGAGVYVWSPVFKDWTEVSVRGNVFTPREIKKDGGDRILSFRTNEIVAGSIIQLSGAYLLFQGAHQLSSQMLSCHSPAEMLRDINMKRPHCPVLFSSIEAQYLSHRDRLVDSFSKKFAINPVGSAQVVGCTKGTMSTFRSEETADSAPPFVFTACGHVHAYSKEFIGRY